MNSSAHGEKSDVEMSNNGNGRSGKNVDKARNSDNKSRGHDEGKDTYPSSQQRW